VAAYHENANAVVPLLIEEHRERVETRHGELEATNEHILNDVAALLRGG